MYSHVPRRVSLSAALLLASCGSDGEQEASRDASSELQPDTGTVPEGGVDSGEDIGTDEPVDAPPLEFHVSVSGDDASPGTATAPFATLGRALDAVADSKVAGAEGDIRVWVHSGRYVLDAPLVFRDGHCGTNDQRVIIQGSEGEAIPVFSGARELPASTWTEEPPGSGTWTAPWNDGTVRELYAAGKALVRAREPDVLDPLSAPVIGSWLDNDYHQFTLPAAATASLSADATGLEVVMPMGWAVSRLRILAFLTDEAAQWAYFSPREPEGSIETDKAASAKDGIGPFHAGTQRVWLEGHPGLIDTIGEWAYDTASARLVVRTGTSEPPQDVLVPALDTLATFDGCENVTLEDVAFAHAGWGLPSTQGYVGVGVGQHYVRKVDGNLAIEPDLAAVRLRDTKGIVFRRVSLTDLAGRGVDSIGGQGNRWEENLFARTGSAALVLQSEQAAVVDQNVFLSIGSAYGGDALGSVYCEGTRIERNYMADIASRAVFAFDHFFVDAGGTPEPGTIFRNRVHDVVQLTTDTGALNFGGATGFTISENAVRGVRPSGWNTGAGWVVGVYLDIGSYRVTVKDNAIADAEVPFQLNCQVDNEVVGNEVTESQGEVSAVTYGACTLFHDAMTPPSWQLLHEAMTEAGCVVDVANGTESCPCNATRDCWTSSVLQQDGVGSANAQGAWVVSGPEPHVFAHWGVSPP